MFKKLFSIFAALTLSVGLWAQSIEDVKAQALSEIEEAKIAAAAGTAAVVTTAGRESMGVAPGEYEFSCDVKSGVVTLSYTLMTTALPDVNSKSLIQDSKLIKNGQLIIRKGDKDYNALGNEL